jgi:exonuclease V gamma subunit
LPEPQEADLDLSLDELVRFFKNPTEYLLRERLNVSLEPQVFSIKERESFQLDGLDRYKAEHDLLQEMLINTPKALLNIVLLGVYCLTVQPGTLHTSIQ